MVVGAGNSNTLASANAVGVALERKGQHKRDEMMTTGTRGTRESARNPTIQLPSSSLSV